MQALFLSEDGYPLTNTGVHQMLKRLGRAASIQGVRVSAHTFRHTCAVSLLRNGADAFSVERILGHADLATTRIYVNLAEADIAAVHRRASPVDNLRFLRRRA